MVVVMVSGDGERVGGDDHDCEYAGGGDDNHDGGGWGGDDCDCEYAGGGECDDDGDCAVVNVAGDENGR